MNELPRTINGATLPFHEVWWNPQNLDLERFGPNHRPMTKTEWERTERHLPISFYVGAAGVTWSAPYEFLGLDNITYRLPSNTPFLMPEKEWKPKFSVGDWVKINCSVGTLRGERAQVRAVNEAHQCYYLTHEKDGQLVPSFRDEDLAWTLGPVCNGHALQPGQRWHREDWKQEDLPHPYRPLILDEMPEVGDEQEFGPKWIKQKGQALQLPAKGGHRDVLQRTTRPLPKVERAGSLPEADPGITLEGLMNFVKNNPPIIKPEPAAHPAVTDTICNLAQDAYMTASGSSIRPSKVGLKSAISHAFSQALPGLEERLERAQMKIDNYVVTTEEAKLELQKAKAEIADLTRRLECVERTKQMAIDSQGRVCVERDAHKARADKAEGELESAWSRQESTIKELQREIDYRRSVCEERDQAHRELASHQWISLDVRKPTAEDADERGAVEVLHPDRTIDAIQWHSVATPQGRFTHWRKTNLPTVEKVEPSEREEFEKWWQNDGQYAFSGGKANAESVWQVAWNKALQGKHPTCAHCGKIATCLGSYEGSENAYACDDCCAHGNEDGKCKPIQNKAREAKP